MIMGDHYGGGGGYSGSRSSSSNTFPNIQIIGAAASSSNNANTTPQQSQQQLYGGGGGSISRTAEGSYKRSSTSKNNSEVSNVFLQDSLGRWSCRHCNSVPFKFRAPGAVYTSHNSMDTGRSSSPPSLEVIERHLQLCCGNQFYSAQGGNEFSEDREKSDASSPTVAYQARVSSSAMLQASSITSPTRSPPIPVRTSGYPSMHPPPPQQQHQMPSHYPAPRPYSNNYPSYATAVQPIPPPPSAYYATHMHGFPPPSSGHGPPPMMQGSPHPHHYSNPNHPPSSLPYPTAAGMDYYNKVPTYGASRHSQQSYEEPLPENSLVLREDKAILTEYFFYLMNQFKPCIFLESDRNAKGRKRDNIPVGFAGIQCRHCGLNEGNDGLSSSSGRKFFWSSVDRLANSFTEIPCHLLKCRRCPSSVRDRLLKLKKTHLEEMARMPRGSQKVFFRRMWRRLHEEKSDDNEDENNSNTQPMKRLRFEPLSRGSSNLSAPASLPKDILTAPVEAYIKSCNVVLLSTPDDRDWLSDLDCFVRKNLEVFVATREDVEMMENINQNNANASFQGLFDRPHRVKEGQVGMRCIHCAALWHSKSVPMCNSAVFYPNMICDIFEYVREFQKLHLNCEHGSAKKVADDDDSNMTNKNVCPNLPPSYKEQLESLNETVSSLNSMLKRYSVLSAKSLGFFDTNSGIRAKRDSVFYQRSQGQEDNL